MSRNAAKQYFDDHNDNAEQQEMFDPDLLSYPEKYEIEVTIKVKPADGKTFSLPLVFVKDVPKEKLGALIEAAFEQRRSELRSMLATITGFDQVAVL